MSNIRKGDNVVVISGSDKGKKGSVLKVFPKENRALVQGVNMVKRHQRLVCVGELAKFSGVSVGVASHALRDLIETAAVIAVPRGIAGALAVFFPHLKENGGIDEDHIVVIQLIGNQYEHVGYCSDHSPSSVRKTASTQKFFFPAVSSVVGHRDKHIDKLEGIYSLRRSVRKLMDKSYCHCSDGLFDLTDHKVFIRRKSKDRELPKLSKLTMLDMFH